MLESKNNPAFNFFLYLLKFFSLGFVIFPVGIIAFQFINKLLPASDFSYDGMFDQSAVKFAIAAIFIAGPVFFTCVKIINSRIFDGRISEDSITRRWLTYIVMFFAAGTIIGDLITLVVNFLEGDIAGKFLLKVLVVLILAGGIFGYYFLDMNRKDMQGKEYKENKIIFYSFLAVVLIAFVSAFFIIDSPTVSRNKKIDQRLLNDIQNIDNNIQGYYNKTATLPESLEQLKNTEFSPFIQGDVKEIEYRKLSNNSFELCAEFILSGQDQQDVVLEKNGESGDWSHKAGKVCFDRVAVPESGLKNLP